MSKTSVLFLFISFIGTIKVYAQLDPGPAVNVSGTQLSTITQQALTAEFFENITSNSNTLSYSDVEGTPYMEQDFLDGDIVYTDGKILKAVQLNWNLYTGKFEFYHQQLKQNFSFDCNSIPIRKIFWNNLEFVCYQDDIYELIHEGTNYKVLSKGEVKFNPEVKLEPYKQPRAASFSSAKYDISIIKGKNLYPVKRNLKNIPKLLSVTKSELKSHIKQVNYHPDNKDSVYKLFDQIDNQHENSQ